MNPEDVIRMPEGTRIEGGDIMPFRDHIFIGCATPDDFKNFTTARTNIEAVNFL